MNLKPGGIIELLLKIVAAALFDTFLLQWGIGRLETRL